MTAFALADPTVPWLHFGVPARNQDAADAPSRCIGCPRRLFCESAVSLGESACSGVEPIRSVATRKRATPLMEDAMTRQALYAAASTARASARSTVFLWRVRRALRRWLETQRTRRALLGLSDELLTDLGLTRGEVDYVAGAITQGSGDPSRDRQHPVNRAVPRRAAGG
jgi:uncharacterized protein YjiS (DUF1127 family)